VEYTGTLKGDSIELQRTFPQLAMFGRRGPVAEPTGPRPAIGPPPDGSDPSSLFGMGLGGGRGGRGMQTPPPLVLHRAKT
jgi:beta-galactosidase